MAAVKIMVVPGKIARVELTSGMTVLDACETAERQIPGVGWTQLAKTREVRVQNRKFSNSAEVTAGFAGSIAITPLNDGEVVLILTKIKGNGGAPGEGVLTVTIDGQEYALETPERLDVVLANVAGYDLNEVKSILVNGEESPLDQLVGSGDLVVVKFYGDEEEDEVEIDIDDLYQNTLADDEGEEYLLSTADPTPEPEADTSAELNSDELVRVSYGLEAQAEVLCNQAVGLRDLAEAIRQVETAKSRLAELGYEL